MVNGHYIEFPAMPPKPSQPPPSNDNAMEAWEEAYQRWRAGQADEPGPPPEIDDQTRYLVAVWRILLEDMQKLPPNFLDKIIKDDQIDPDDRGVYYSGDHRARYLCSLGDVRAMARISRCARILAKVLSMGKPPGLAKPLSEFP